MTTGDVGEVTVDGKGIEVVTKFVFLGALITKDGLCEKELWRRIAMGKAAMGGLTSIWKDGGVTLETKVKLVKVLVFPIDLYGEGGDLDNEKTWEKENRRFRVVVLEKSTESIVDGENDKHMDHREHQTGMDTGVQGAKGYIKLLWARVESRWDGRWRDARENEWSEK